MKRSIFSGLIFSGLLCSMNVHAVVWSVLKEPVHKVAAKGTLEEIVSWVDKYGVNDKDSYKQTLLFIAADTGRTDVVKMLLDRGASVNAVSATLLTPLHVAAGKGYFDIAKMLLDKGASLDAKSNTGETPLDWAKGSRNKEVIDLLSAKN